MRHSVKRGKSRPASPFFLRVSHAFVVVDVALGAFFGTLFFFAGTWLIMVTGPLSSGERDWLGQRYVSALSAIETSAGTLRHAYCERELCAS